MSSLLKPVGHTERPYMAELEAAILHHRAGRLNEATRAYQHILAQYADCADAHNLLGTIARTRGDCTTALAHFEAAIDINPNEATFYYHKAVALQDERHYLAARDAYLHTLELAPKHVSALENLGIVYAKLGDATTALVTLERALKLTPDAPQLLANYAEVLRVDHQLTAAAAAARRAILLAPDLLLARRNLAATLYKLGDIPGTRAALQPVLAADPLDYRSHSTWLMTDLYGDDFDPVVSFKGHRAWDERHGQPLLQHASSIRRPALLQRRLRVGYISPDLRRHAVARFIAPILQHHDHQDFEIFCYSDVARPDAVTQRLRNYADHWRDISGWSDEQLTAAIRTDDIDILIDLAGHTSGNRLRVFAQRSAPVQISYCGYPASTGLASMDYRITDAQADPPDTTEHWHSETLLRLPDTFLCYEPLATAPAPHGPPVLRNGYITFASFNNLAKLTRHTVAVWAKLLKALPTARLLLKTPSLAHSESQLRIVAWFAAEGIDQQRLEIIGAVSDDAEFLRLYHRVDIALDTFPYHGTTTTCDALWMGVPVITQIGAHHVSRVGASLLHAVGLNDLIAHATEAVVDKALLLALDLPRLQHLRQHLRHIMSELPLTQGTAFTCQFEAALHQAWETTMTAPQNQLRPHHTPAESPAGRTANRGNNMSTVITLPGKVRCFARDSLDDLTNYVLREQGDWFESDIEWVRRYLRPGMGMLDVGAGIGVYALTAAERVGSRGVVDAIESDHELTELLRLGQTTNAFSQLHIHTLDGVATLSKITSQSNTPGVDYDLIRIDGEINAMEAIEQLRDKLTTTSPLLMVFTHADAQLITKLKQELTPLGYAAYVYIPGLKQLTLDCAEIADPYQLNLYFAGSERVAELTRQGLIAIWHEADTLSQPRADALLWHEHLARLPFSTAFASLWNTTLASANGTPGQQAYFNAMNLYVLAHSTATEDSDRLAYLLAALDSASRAIAEHSNSSRLLTLTRVCTDLGLRNMAVKTLTVLREVCAGTDPLDVSEPFIPPLAEFEMRCEQDSPGAWLVRTITTAYEKQASLSSYFGDNDTLHYLGGLDAQDLLTPDLEKRYVLQYQRVCGKPPERTRTVRKQPPLAIIYHLARSGGTLISKCLASIDGNLLLSEVNPSVSVQDPLLQAQQWHGLISEEEFLRYRHENQLNYRESIRLIADRAQQRGQHLILRDWTHIDFTAVPFVDIPRFVLSQSQALQEDFSLRQAITVRHPLDTYLSLTGLPNMQDKLTPALFMRGYCLFARIARSMDFFRYEDFCAAPERIMRNLCAELGVNYADNFMHRQSTYQNITGDVDTGRGGKTIKLPQRRALPEALIEELIDNDDYHEIIELLDYKRGF